LELYNLIGPLKKHKSKLAALTDHIHEEALWHVQWQRTSRFGCQTKSFTSHHHPPNSISSNRMQD